MKKKKQLKKEKIISPIIIKELNPILSHYNGDIKILQPILSYKEEIWINDLSSMYPKKKREIVTRYLIGQKGIFLTGFLPKVKEHLDFENIPYIINSYPSSMKTTIGSPKLKKIKFYKWQEKALSTMLPEKRGIWIAPTAAGKTILYIGIMKALNTSSVVIVHTKALFNQTYKELCKFFPIKDVGQIGDSKKDIKKYNVGMVKTMANLKEDYSYTFGLIIIDECHHASILKTVSKRKKKTGIYTQVLQRTNAPYRYGVTATRPPQESKQLIMEGLLGPVLGKTTYKELIEEGIIAKPKMIFELVPPNKKYNKLKSSYVKVYEKGIVKNRMRNQLIIKAAKEQMEQGRSVLIIIERLEHGKELLKFAKIELPKDSYIFLHGKTDSEALEQAKKARKNWLSLRKQKKSILLDLDYKLSKIDKTLKEDKTISEAKNNITKEKVGAKDEMLEAARQKFEKKEMHCVIATRVWVEGINVKSIGAVINGVGGNSELAVIQRFGRGMRIDKDKKEIILVDFIDSDSYRWFERHSMERLCFYSKRGWI